MTFDQRRMVMSEQMSEEGEFQAEGATTKALRQIYAGVARGLR